MTARRCRWCRELLSATAPGWQLFCGKRCRQTEWRARRVSLMEGRDGRKRIAYADPPYPGMAYRCYGDQPNYAGEVDHAELVGRLLEFDGWALSTSAKALRLILPLCPPEARVAAWVKPIGVSRKTRGPHSTWEPVIYQPARWQPPGRRDWISAMPARGGDSDLLGRKPRRFVLWLFELLGMAPCDAFVDLYPGSEVVTRAWGAASREYSGDAPSRRVLGDGAIESTPSSRETTGAAAP